MSDMAPVADAPSSPFRIDVLTVFPGLVDTFCQESLLGRARSTDRLDLRCHDLRAFTDDVHHTTDDSPFGGGAGMVMKVEPIQRAIEASGCPRPILALGPGGTRLTQDLAMRLAATGGFTLVCGRYEGIDHRVREHLCDGEISVGDVVLAGGEVAACVVIEAVTRLLPGVMGNHESAGDESFGAAGLLEYPQFTRPAVLGDWPIPEILRSGDHARIARWRLAQALHRTIMARPDLIEARGGISVKEQRALDEFPPVAYPFVFP
jgi:tRNA (guanine37-N1)-methyltransferase